MSTRERLLEEENRKLRAVHEKLRLGIDVLAIKTNITLKCMKLHLDEKVSELTKENLHLKFQKSLLRLSLSCSTGGAVSSLQSRSTRTTATFATIPTTNSGLLQ